MGKIQKRNINLYFLIYNKEYELSFLLIHILLRFKISYNSFLHEKIIFGYLDDNNRHLLLTITKDFKFWRNHPQQDVY